MMARKVLAGFALGAMVLGLACSSSPDPPRAIELGPGGDGGASRSDGGPTATDPEGGIEPGGDGGSGEGRLYSGGTRIKARFYQTSDGTLSFLGWNDTQIGIECRFTPSSDGKIRCLPSQAIAYASSYYYRDAACTQRIAYYSPGRCPTPVRYISFTDQTACPSRTRIYAVGTRLATQTAYYNGGSGCQQTTFGTGTELYDLGAEVPASTFVGATEQIGPDLGGVARADILADDGARGVYRFVEPTRNVTCYFRDAADGAYRCLPSEAYVSQSIYANPSCTTLAVSRGTSACPPPNVATSTTAQGCGSVARVFGVGGAATPYYMGSTCTALSSSGAQYYSVGAEIPLSSFAEGRVAVAGGTARVRPKELVLRGGEPYPSGLRDTQRNEDCSFGMAIDGAFRCLPQSSASVYFFSDAQCTQRLAYRVTQAGCTQQPTVAQDYDDSTCPPKYHVYSVGSQVTPANLYVLINSTCTQTTTSGLTFYALGAEIPASSFVQASIVDR